MSWTRLSYAVVLAFCLAATLPLVAVLRLDLVRHWRRLLLTIGLAGGPFLIWDVIVTHVGQWRFDPRQTLPWRIAGLPLEEIAFFVVIPLVSVITLEGVRTVRARSGRHVVAPGDPEGGRSR